MRRELIDTLEPFTGMEKSRTKRVYIYTSNLSTLDKSENIEIGRHQYSTDLLSLN